MRDPKIREGHIVANLLILRVIEDILTLLG